MPEWWNVDLRVFPGIDQQMDVTQPWPWRDRIQYVYGEHFLEHLRVDHAIDFLLEARRALVPSGRLRLSTPSLEWVMSTHFSLEESEPGSMHLQTLALNRAFHGWGHQFIFSKAAIEAALRATGYRDISFFAFGESDRPELRRLERHGGEKVVDGYPSVWIVEASPDPQAADDVDPAYAELVEREFVDHVRRWQVVASPQARVR